MLRYGCTGGTCRVNSACPHAVALRNGAGKARVFLLDRAVWKSCYAMQERTAQWEARHHLYWAIVNAHPGHTYTITDTAVPLVHLSELIVYAQQLLAEMNIQGSIVGQVGDGNFHTIIAAKPEDYERVQTFSERLVRQALAWEGTASGEHGIGLVKRGFMLEEHGASVEWMRRLKALFDPDDLLKPWQAHLINPAG